LPGSNITSRSGANLSTIKRLLLCEGPDDREFFLAFIEERGLSSLGFDVHHNGSPSQPRGGITEFRSSLQARFVLRNGWYRYKDVVLAADNDDHDPIDTNFKTVKAQAEQPLGFFPQKSEDLAVQGSRRVEVLMIPGDGEKGNLESLCRMALTSVDYHILRHLDVYYHSVGVDRWQSTCRRDEMWLRLNLAARCQSDPGISLRSLFSTRRLRRLIP
jgi:hypothetical protein